MIGCVGKRWFWVIRASRPAEGPNVALLQDGKPTDAKPCFCGAFIRISLGAFDREGYCENITGREHANKPGRRWLRDENALPP